MRPVALVLAMSSVPDGKSNPPERVGLVLEQPGPRAGLRAFTRDQPIRAHFTSR